MISRQAALIYKACTGRVVPEESLSAFAGASADEDSFDLTRVVNWHFYNNGKKIGHYRKYFLYCNGSNEEIFKERLDELDAKITGKRARSEIYAAAGRVIHHVQDMSVPSHVVPIYHVSDDKFDNYQSAPLTIADFSPACGDLATRVEPGNLLESSAHNTLKAIAAPVIFDGGKAFAGETWMKFWGGPDDKNLTGFKTCGEYGNSFGDIPPCKDKICSSYNKAVFDSFYRESHRRAVADTVRFLIYLDSRLKESRIN